MTRITTAVLAGSVLAVVNVSPAIGVGATPPRDSQVPLLQEIPAALRKSCQPATSLPTGSNQAITCKPSHVAAQRVLFLSFPDQGAATARYLADGDKHKIPRDTTGDCFSYIDSESPFRTKDGTIGRVFCAHRDHSIEWTYANVVARATGTNDNDLYTWWDHLVGRTLNATQQALSDQAPSGIDKTNCRDNGDASIKCTSPAESVYAVKYTRFPTAEALMAAYSSAVAGAKLTPNSPPPRSPKDVCNFETTWGPARLNSALGRVACFRFVDATNKVTYHDVWTVNGQQTLVDSYSPSLSVVTQFFKAFAVANQTSSFSTGATG